MLCRLSVENYALIDRLDIEFSAGLNIVTGETGAGKSILLGALGLVLGGRTDVSVLRDGARNCVIEAEFDVRDRGLENLFERADVDYEDRTSIRRVISPSGKSRAYVNDLPVQLSALREIGLRLIDIHSQHQTLLLGNGRFQTGIVDAVAGHADLLRRYGAAFDDMTALERELALLRQKASESERDREYVAFQLDELRGAKLVEDEQAELEGLRSELVHASEIRDTLLFASEEFDGAENSLLARLKSLELSLGRIQPFYSAAGEFYTRLHAAVLDLKDMASEIASQSERVDADPDRLDKVERRLDLLYTLQQKHKVTSVAELLALQADYEARLNGIEGCARDIEALEARLAGLRSRTEELAAELTRGRREAVPAIRERVEAMLADLGMPSAHLDIEVVPSGRLSADGADTVRFLFSANRNMALQPVEKVASGGEMSRLMLCIKALVARHSQLPTIVFDEIDTGVSGLVADRMGRIVEDLSSVLQIVNITHLPQVASKGEVHFFVYKEDTAEGTVTRLRRLTPEQRVEEIAKMLSGADVTQAALEQARLLLKAD